jgi:hypothetical protein
MACITIHAVSSLFPPPDPVYQAPEIRLRLRLSTHIFPALTFQVVGQLI